MNTCVVAFMVSGFLVVYGYVLYPMLLWIGARLLRPRENVEQSVEVPFVSIVVAAYNEESVIEQKILNTQRLQYPKDRLEFLVGSDGSTDRTDEIARKFSWVRFFRIEPRKGKANVLNTLIPVARGEVILLSDANTVLEPGAIISLVKHFGDPTVGGVCGRLVLVARGQHLEDAEQSYWSFESKLKEMESLWYSTIGANGGIYAIRKSLFRAIPTDTIIDDFWISLNILEQGNRLVFERDAVGYEEVSKSFRDEFWRKVRIGAGNLQILLRRGPCLFHMAPFVIFAYISHKIIRWLVPIFLLVIWACSYLLSDNELFHILFWGLNSSILLSVVGMMGLVKNGVVLSLAYLYAFNVALLLGYGRYLLGAQRATWRRAQR